MKKNLSKIIMGSLIAGALTFLPAPDRISKAYAGEEIRNNRYYDNVKKEGLGKYGKYLENMIIEKEKQFLIVERHLLKKGNDAQEYFGRVSSFAPNYAIFKGNEVRFISTYNQGIGFAELPILYSEQEKNLIAQETVNYLEEAKQSGYRALINYDPNLQRMISSRQIGIDELIKILRK